MRRFGKGWRYDPDTYTMVPMGLIACESVGEYGNGKKIWVDDNGWEYQAYLRDDRSYEFVLMAKD